MFLDPFFLSVLGVAHEVVQVLHPAGHDLVQPRVRGVLIPVHHGVGNVVFSKFACANGPDSAQLITLRQLTGTQPIFLATDLFKYFRVQRSELGLQNPADQLR
jgi:hypothetical protein